MVSDRFDELSNDKSGAGAANGGLADLQRQIQSHRDNDENKSYLGRAMSYVWGKDEESLSRLKDLQTQTESARKNGDKDASAKVEKQIAQQVDADRKAVALQDEINHYAGGFLKTGALFLRGRTGLAGTVALYALDQMNPRDSLKTQLTDMTLGGAKGGLMKGAFHLLGKKDVSIAAKGVGLGITSRSLDLGLTRSTYTNSAGDFSLGQGLSRTVQGSLSRTALATDVIVFAGAHGLFKGADQLAGGAIKRSPLLSTMLTGTTFGISAGATGEIARQHSAGENFDLWKVVQRGMLQGAVDTFAATPGGLQSRSAHKQLERSNGGDRLLDPRGLGPGSAISSTRSSGREFVVTKGQEVLTAFGAKDSSAAWLKVREVIGRSADGQANLGIERTLVLQHRGASQSGLPEAVKSADLIATCNPETLAPAVQAKHVFGAGEGPVWLSRTAAGDRFRLSVGGRPGPSASQGYEKVLQLGFSREMMRALSRAEQGDKRYKEVEMDGIGKLSSKPTDKDKMIFTAGLGGCTAVVLLVERADGTRTAVISHEIAYRATEQFEKIEKVARTIPGLFDPGTKKTALVFTAQAFEGDPFTGRVKMLAASCDAAGASHLVESLRSMLGVTGIRSMTYNANERYSQPVDEGVLSLRLPAGRPATFKTWFSKEQAFDFTPTNDNLLPQRPVASEKTPANPPAPQPVEQKLAG